jgi:hypothetical protein
MPRSHPDEVRLVVDLDKVTVVLADAEDVTQALVVVAAPSHASAASEVTVHRLADVLAATNVGTLQPDGTARLRADAVRFHAAGQVDDDWERRFADACTSDGDQVVVAAKVPVRWPAS